MVRLGFFAMAFVLSFGFWRCHRPQPSPPVKEEVIPTVGPAPAKSASWPIIYSVPKARPPERIAESGTLSESPTPMPERLSAPRLSQVWPGWSCYDLDSPVPQSLWVYGDSEEASQLYEGTCSEWEVKGEREDAAEPYAFEGESPDENPDLEDNYRV